MSDFASSGPRCPPIRLVAADLGAQVQRRPYQLPRVGAVATKQGFGAKFSSSCRLAVRAGDKHSPLGSGLN